MMLFQVHVFAGNLAMNKSTLTLQQFYQIIYMTTLGEKAVDVYTQRPAAVTSPPEAHSPTVSAWVQRVGRHGRPTEASSR